MNIDQDFGLRNADWINTVSWDLPTTVEPFLAAIGGPDKLAHFLTLPAAEAMPTELRLALDIREMEKSLKRDYVRDEIGRFAETEGAADFDMQTALDEAMTPAAIADALKTGGFEKTEIGEGSPVWVSADGQQVVTWDQTSNYADLADIDRFIYDADTSEYYPDYDQQFSKDFWERPEPLYHATTVELDRGSSLKV